MEFKIYRNSHVGIMALIIELIITMISSDSLLERFTLIHFHPAIRILIDIVIAVVIFFIFASGKIGCIIVSLFYSAMWTLLVGSITDEFSHGDKIWIMVIGGITFLISLGVHLSSMSDTGHDYVVTSDDEI